MKIYYAHSVHLFNTAQEKRDIALLKSMGFEVVNPNTPAVEKHLKKFTDEYIGSNMMDAFKPALNKCDAIAFRAHPDGKISAGVAFQLAYMQGQGKPIIELPTLVNSRILSVSDTKEYLRLLGNR